MTKKIIDDNGFVEIKDNPLSMVGVFDYYGHEIGADEPDRLYKVFRSPETLESAVPFFKGKPIVNEHTMLGDGQKDAGEKGIDGVIGDDVYFKDDTIYGNIRLFTNSIKEELSAGKKELSFGYWSRYTFEEGSWQGKAYDAVQDIVGGNHLALIKDGRMGAVVSVMDEAIKINFKDSENETKMSEKEKTEDEEIEKTEDSEAEETEDSEAETEKTEDEEAEKEKTEDSEAEETEDSEADDIKASLDSIAKRLTRLEGKKATTDHVAAVRASIHDATAMYNKVQPIVGTFDYSAKTSKQIAEYAAKKLGLSGHAETAVNTYLTVKTMDSAASVKVTGDAVLNVGEF